MLWMLGVLTILSLAISAIGGGELLAFIVLQPVTLLVLFVLLILGFCARAR